VGIVRSVRRATRCRAACRPLKKPTCATRSKTWSDQWQTQIDSRSRTASTGPLVTRLSPRSFATISSPCYLLPVAGKQFPISLRGWVRCPGVRGTRGREERRAEERLVHEKGASGAGIRWGGTTWETWTLRDVMPRLSYGRTDLIGESERRSGMRSARTGARV